MSVESLNANQGLVTPTWGKPVAYTGLALQTLGGLGSAVSGYSGGMASADAMYANARNLRAEAKARYKQGVANEHLMRLNASSASGQARAMQAGSGFLSTGTGGLGETTMLKQFEHQIAQQAVVRENQRRTALNQADMMDWQARQMKRASKRNLIGGLIGTGAGLVAGLGSLGMASGIAGAATGAGALGGNVN